MSALSPGSWSEQKVYASDGNPQAWLGSAVAIADDIALVGAKNTTIDGQEHQGAVYVYRKVAGVWKQSQKLIANDGAAGDQFGTSVAVSGAFAIVTAPFAKIDGKTWQGAAYVFSVSSEGCKQTQKIVADAGAAFDTFGMLVRMSSSWAFISAGGATHGGTVIPLRVFAFRRVPARSRDLWVERGRLDAPEPKDPSSAFGSSIVLTDSLAVIGARTATPYGRAGQGAAYVYNYRGSSGWMLETRLTAQDGAARDNFGVSVGLNGEEILVGAFGAVINGNVSQGAVYRFNRIGEEWKFVQKIVADDGSASSLFGASMSVSNQRLLVGAYAVEGYRGAAYVFAFSANRWRQIKKLTASDRSSGDVFGYYTALSKSDALVGAYGAFANGNLRQGAAYFFAQPQSGWSMFTEA